LLVNANGMFQPSPARLPAGQYRKAVWLDYDHDYDLDLILLGPSSKLVRNNGAAGFSDLTSDFPFVPGTALDGVVMDLNPYENRFDLVVSYAERTAVIYRDRLGGKYDAVPFDPLPGGASGLTTADWNHDSWTDLLATAGGEGRLYLNRAERLEMVEQPLPGSPGAGVIVVADFDADGSSDLLRMGTVFRRDGIAAFAPFGSLGPTHPGLVVAADFGQDGNPEAVAFSPHGSLVLYASQPGRNRAWTQVRLEGVKNLKLAPGARVEVKAGSLYQKQTYQGVPLIFGLGSRTRIDTIRITWPNGLIQNEVNQPVNQHLSFKEAQRLSGSCPMVFTWNGKEFQFITDVLGVAPLGASLGDGQYFPVDHDEYIQIPGSALEAVDGRYEIRITEELREVAFLDKVQLIAVDHPREVEVFTNEKFKGPPFPEFRLFGVSQRIYPQVARDEQGNDVLARLQRKDRAYPDGFRRDYSGVAEMHALDLDFGSAAPGNNAILVLNGWVDWADGSTFRAVSQEGGPGLVTPYLQVKNPAGEWETVVEDMGMPAGKPKTMVVDLTGKFRSDSRAVRIVTNLALYWDEIFLSENSGEPEVRLTPLDAETAELRFRGFSTPVIHPERKQPERFDYQRWMPVSMWNPTPGMYTRYGDVRPLVLEADDRMVVMGSGDELRLLYPASQLPPLPEGWSRDFLLLVDGWAKDQDANTAFGSSVEPLPFHGMSQYPYPANEQFPDSEEHRRYRNEYNTRPALRLVRPLTETTRLEGGWR
ncbi:MAG TPA: CRTAC1 family protein, partial [Terriglobia bacterium]|nr:CRTAC1 family protein [Terriglobia bacterium]